MGGKKSNEEHGPSSVHPFIRTPDAQDPKFHFTQARTPGIYEQILNYVEIKRLTILVADTGLEKRADYS